MDDSKKPETIPDQIDRVSRQAERIEDTLCAFIDSLAAGRTLQDAAQSALSARNGVILKHAEAKYGTE